MKNDQLVVSLLRNTVQSTTADVSWSELDLLSHAAKDELQSLGDEAETPS